MSACFNCHKSFVDHLDLYHVCPPCKGDIRELQHSLSPIFNPQIFMEAVWKMEKALKESAWYLSLLHLDTKEYIRTVNKIDQALTHLKEAKGK